MSVSKQLWEGDMHVGDEIAYAILPVALLTLAGTALSVWLAVQAAAERRTTRLEATVLRVRQAAEDHVRLAGRQLPAGRSGPGAPGDDAGGGGEREADLELAYRRLKSFQNAAGAGVRAAFHRHVAPAGSRLAERSLHALTGDRPWSAARAADEILEAMWARGHAHSVRSRRVRFQPVGPVRPHSGFFLEAGGGPATGFELVCPAGGGLEHWRRSGGGGRDTWVRVSVREPGVGELGDASFVVGDPDAWGSREVVVRAGADLLHFRSEGPGARWREARQHSLLQALGPRAEAEVAGDPAFIQGLHGGRGNLEVLVPRRGAGGLVHLWRESDTSERRWRTGTPAVVAAELGPVAAVALVHSRDQLGALGTLELVARAGERLFHYRRSPVPPWSWHRVACHPDGSVGGEPASGAPSLVQGPPTPGDAVGSLHLAAPRPGGGVACLRRRLEDPARTRWEPQERFAEDRTFAAVSLLWSASLGGLLLAGRTRDAVHFYRRADDGSWAEIWAPTPIAT